jgi:hypothetical protein
MRTQAPVHVIAGHDGTVADVKSRDSDPQVITGNMDSTVTQGGYLFALCHLFGGPLSSLLFAFVTSYSLANSHPHSLLSHPPHAHPYSHLHWYSHA